MKNHSPAARRSPRFILASGSPRRRDLLQEAGFAFSIVSPEVDEWHDEGIDLRELTLANARLKADAAALVVAGSLVLAADTLVAIEGTALGKPADLAEAKAMLGRLVGKTHEVCTGVAIRSAEGVEESFLVVTRVTFLPLIEAEIAAYLALINPLDKAGSYAAQEHGDRIIAHVDGSWTNVVGLPMDETVAALARHGVKPEQSSAS
jgi:septum formation protein